MPIEAEDAARRLARAIASDLSLYNEEKSSAVSKTTASSKSSPRKSKKAGRFTKAASRLNSTNAISTIVR